MTLLGTSLIGSKRGAQTGAVAHAANPATGAVLEPAFHSATTEEINQAVTLAEDAFLEFGNLPATKRAAFLRRVADLIQEATPTLVERANLESGLPAARLTGEIGRTTGQLRLFAEVVEAGLWLDARIDHGDPQRQPLPKPELRSCLRPVGPVVVFSASNFPFAFSVAGGDVASAWAAGCPVIVKAHQAHPGTSELTGSLVQQAVKECGLPEGTFSLVFGPGREVGMALVKHPGVKAVGFTGSVGGGRALMDAAAARPEPIPVYAEMGSINPIFILPSAMTERGQAIAAGLHTSVTMGVGQFCTNPGLIFVQESPETQAFLTTLAKLMSETTPGTMLTSGICSAFHAGVEKFSKAAGVERLAHVSTPSPANGPATGGAALFTTTLANFLSQPQLMDEVFGPSTLVVRVPDCDGYKQAAKSLHGQLTATLHASAEEVKTCGLLPVLELKAGRLVFNSFPTGVEVCHAMNHGGPYPATSDGRSTSVGTRAILRFARIICYQGFPEEVLPAPLQEANPDQLTRLVDGKLVVA